MTDQTPQTPAPKAPRKWTRIVLILSLAINLLVVAALVGAFFKHDKRQGPHLDRASMGLGAYILALPEPAQSEVMAMIGKGSEDRREFRKTMYKLRKDTETALQATPFSVDAVKSALDQQRNGALQRTAQVQDAYLTALAAMTDAERAAHFERAAEIKAERFKKRREKKADD